MKTLKANLTSGYQTTENVFGISGGLVSNDIVAAVKHPDTSSGNPSSSEQESYTYNQLGQVLTYTDRNGSVHTYAYDVLGRVTSDAITTLGSGVDGTVRRIETAYDTQGNAYLFTSYDAASSGNIVNQVQREFNGLGQLITEWQAVGGAVNTSTSPKVQYAYSFSASGSMNHSRLTSITYPNGRVITFNYASGLSDNISRLSSITDGSTTLESYEFLGYATVVKRGHAQPGVDLTFIKQSGESNGDAGDPYIGLDRFGRIADNRWRTSSADLERRKYGYDRDSNRLFAENLVDSSRSELYAYDGLNQIVSFDRGTLSGTKDGISGSPSRSQDWDFDALGNWDSLTTDGGSAVTRSHNKQNEITGISGSTTPTYDANGNLTTDETGRTFKYDALNRLVEVRDSGSTLLATYRHDALGRRIRETRGSTTTDLYFSAQWQVLEERIGSDVKVSYVWSPVYIDAMIARDRDTDANGSLDERLYALHDANFNIVALVDTSGAVVERYAYDAFGGFVVLTPSWGSRSSTSYDWKYQHQGVLWDADVAAFVVRHRILGPTIGRFYQVDPLGFGAGDQNLYRGLANNPVAFNDPSGLILPAIIIGGVVVGVLLWPSTAQAPTAPGDYGPGIDWDFGPAAFYSAPFFGGAGIGWLLRGGYAELWMLASLRGQSAAAFLAAIIGGESNPNVCMYGLPGRGYSRPGMIGGPSRGVNSGVAGLPRGGTVGSHPNDPAHNFPGVIDNFAPPIPTAMIPTRGPGGVVTGTSRLYQVEGELNGVPGIFEWVVDASGVVTHRRFIPRGQISHAPNQPIPPRN